MTVGVERGDGSTGAAIRDAVLADVGSVVAIERESFGDPWNEDDFVAAVDAAHAIFLIASGADGVVAGYAMALFVADEAEIVNIAVTGAARGKGFGGALLDAALARLRARGVETVFLEVRDSNERARALYESRGFAGLSRRKMYYRNPVEDALVLRLAMQG